MSVAVAVNHSFCPVTAFRQRVSISSTREAEHHRRPYPTITHMYCHVNYVGVGDVGAKYIILRPCYLREDSMKFTTEKVDQTIS